MLAKRQIPRIANLVCSIGSERIIASDNNRNVGPAKMLADVFGRKAAKKLAQLARACMPSCGSPCPACRATLFSAPAVIAELLLTTYCSAALAPSGCARRLHDDCWRLP